MEINCFINAHRACDRDDRKSIFIYVVLLCPNVVSMSFKKQHVVSKSSTELGYGMQAFATVKVIWIQALLSKLHIKILIMLVI